ncbi:MAG TPA: MBL fold metallo-hydrolase [Anaerolineae bacterium]|nr:MBL fold metallo-hydrolase [Anaerolineae bacterium]
MYRERIADDVYVFTSGLYAQVTAGAVVTPEGVVVIDTLPFPSETRQILDFLNQRSPAGIRYLILTHYHVDHTLGASLFRGVPIIAHAQCRALLAERGAAALAAAREQNPELYEVALRLPDIVFDEGELSVRLGGKVIALTHLPGHSADGVSAYLKDDKILFASDTMTPVPMIVDGDPRQLIESLRRIKSFGLENVVQGHGELILRGEINESVNSNVNYLNRILALVAGLMRERAPRDAVREHSIEACGKSRIPLHGLVQQFHLANLYSLYDRMRMENDLYRLGLRLLAERETPKTEPRRIKPVKKRPAVAPKKPTTSAAAKPKTKAPTRAKTTVRTKTTRSAARAKVV